MKLIHGRVRERRWLILLAALLLMIGGGVTRTQWGRWAVSRAFVVAYSILEREDQPDGIVFGPPEQKMPEPEMRSAPEIERILAHWFTHRRSTFELTSGMQGAEWVHHFRHEDLQSALVERLKAEAGDLLETDNLFELCARMRSLTLHGVPSPALTTDPLACFDRARQGLPIKCQHFAVLFGALCTAKGYTTRLIGLSWEGQTFDHGLCEVFVPQFHKWILFDPDFNVAWRRKNEWLNARELQQIWRRVKLEDCGPERPLDEFCGRLRQARSPIPALGEVELVVLGNAGQAYRQSNLLGRFTGKGLEFFEYVFYATRNDYLSHSYSCGHPARWKQFVLMADPSAAGPAACPEAYACTDADSLYWSVGRTVIYPERYVPEKHAIIWNLYTYTPNFKFFETCVDGGPWQRLDGATISLPCHDGENTLEVRSVNLGDLSGETAGIRIQLAPEWSFRVN